MSTVSDQVKCPQCGYEEDRKSTCTEELQEQARAHFASCGECGLDSDGDAEPCEEYFKLVGGFEPRRSMAVWPDGTFRHYDVPRPVEGEL
jgi:hypothetical protein